MVKSITPKVRRRCYLVRESKQLFQIRTLETIQGSLVLDTVVKAIERHLKFP